MNIFDDCSDLTIYKRILLKTYKEIFSGTIKESFLVDMHERVFRDPRYLIIVSENNDPKKTFTIKACLLRKNIGTFSICKMVVMNHYMNTVSMTEFDRGKAQNQEIYKNKLVNDVIQMYQIEPLATPNYSSSSLEAYLPIIYYVSALNNYCANKYDEFVNKK